MEQPSIELFGIKILEPVTSATDLLVAAVCFYAYYQLRKINRPEKSHRFMKYYLLSLAIATTVAALMAHAFLYVMGPKWKLPGWVLSMIAVSWLERSSISHATPLMGENPAKWIKWGNYVELAFLIGATIITGKFLFVEIHSAMGLLIVAAPLHFMAWKKEKDYGSRYILFAIASSAVAVSFFSSKIGISKWFNHSDIAHVFLAISAYCTYLGALNMKTHQRKSSLKKVAIQ